MTTEQDNQNQRIQVLLAEYQTCQAHTNALSSQIWTSISIIFSLNAVLIGGLAYLIISSNEFDRALLTLIIGSVLGITLVVYFHYFMRPWIN